MERFFETNSELKPLEENIEKAVSVVSRSYKSGGKILLCGNGGSAADCQHISGELLKGFLLKRPIPENIAAKINEYGSDIAKKLQGGLPAISLVSNCSVITAIINDIGGEMVFAQQVYAMAKKEDVLIAISTSGNSQSVYNAAITAKALGCNVVAFTGKDGGKLKNIADVLINAPESETYKVQELHQKIYHYICAVIENNFFGG